MDIHEMKANADYQSIDLNATGATSVLSPSGDTAVYGVFLKNGGSTAEVELQVTDGTNTATLADKGAGANLEFGDTIVLDASESLQIDVTTAEGAAQTNTAVVFKGD